MYHVCTCTGTWNLNMSSCVRILWLLTRVGCCPLVSLCEYGFVLFLPALTAEYMYSTHASVTIVLPDGHSNSMIAPLSRRIYHSWYSVKRGWIVRQLTPKKFTWELGLETFMRNHSWRVVFIRKMRADSDGCLAVETDGRAEQVRTDAQLFEPSGFQFLTLRVARPETYC